MLEVDTRESAASIELARGKDPLPDHLLRDPRVTRILDAITAELQRQRDRARREGWL